MSNHNGFTLVELLVSTAILGIILVGVSTLFMQSLTASARNNQRQELRSEGQFAIDVMSTIIRNAKLIEPCGSSPSTPITSSEITVVGVDNLTSVFNLAQNPITKNMQIASNSSIPQDARITSDTTEIIANNLFTCATNSNQQPYVTIRFTASKQNSLDQTLEQSFRHTVVTRNKATTK